jgi:hypothetical protein
MLDLSRHLDPVWPDDLKPVGEGDIDKEEFETWWERNRLRLANLHRLIAEQWIYRHWTHSPFAFVPLESIRWELAEMTGDEVLARVRREFAGPLDPEFDYGVFQEKYLGRKLATSFALDQGTWDYPIITLRTPNGMRNHEGDFPDVRLVLLEGHQRHRYLNALHALGKAHAGPHKVFLLASPRAD